MLILVRGKKMRAGVLAVGVFLLVIGVIVFWIGYSDLEQYGGLFGEIAQSLSQEVRNKVAQDQFMAVGGGITAIIGLALTVFGLAANRK
jgi:flagellar biosynthesis/type III secretory pathway M-ring protein FliF/YscJ